MDFISSRLGITIAICVMSYEFIEMAFSFFFIPVFFKSGITVFRNSFDESIDTSKFELNKTYTINSCKFKFIKKDELLFLKRTNFVNEKSFFMPLRGSIDFQNTRVTANFRFPLGLVMILFWGAVVVFSAGPEILKDASVQNPDPAVFFPIFGIVVPPIMIYIDYRMTKGKIINLTQDIIQFLKSSNAGL